jgi:hypothetical protein
VLAVKENAVEITCEVKVSHVIFVNGKATRERKGKPGDVLDRVVIEEQRVRRSLRGLALKYRVCIYVTRGKRGD